MANELDNSCRRRGSVDSETTQIRVREISLAGERVQLGGVLLHVRKSALRLDGAR
jgi:hypothetical protein